MGDRREIAAIRTRVVLHVVALGYEDLPVVLVAVDPQ